MGLCSSSASVYVIGADVSLPHFELARSLGEGGFGIVRACAISKHGAALGEVARQLLVLGEGLLAVMAATSLVGWTRVAHTP